MSFYWKMEKSKFINSVAVSLSLLVFATEASATLSLTADLDSRYENTNFKDSEVKVEALGFSLKKVFADAQGDRLVLFTLVDAMDNFRDVMVDQGYIQYKGPMGRWNVILGRYIVPFGLLPNYSSKRLLVKTLEYETVGLNSDSGLQVSGVIRDFDYAISLSQGTGVDRWTDIDNEPVVSFRVGRQGADYEDVRVGLSGLWGKVMPDKIHSNMHSPVYKKLLAIDLIKYHGPMVVRAEVTAGEENRRFLNGVFLGTDYAILPKTDLNFAYTHMETTGHRTDAITAGITYNVFAGFQIRVAQKFSLRGDEDVSSFQIYNIITRTF